MFVKLIPMLLALLLPLLICYVLARFAVGYAMFRLGFQKPVRLFFVFKNQEKFVEGFLWKFFHLLGVKDGKAMEVFVVDNASDDDTGAILDRWARNNGCFYLDGSWEAVNLDSLNDGDSLCYDLRQVSGKDWRHFLVKQR